MTRPTRLPDRHPYEVYILVVTGLFGVLDLIGIAPTPASIQAQIPAQWVWSLSITVGAALALTGLFWPRPVGIVKVTPLLLERVGVVMVGCASIVYAAALVATQGAVGAYAAMLNAGFGVASLAQSRKIRAFVRSLRPSDDTAPAPGGEPS